MAYNDRNYIGRVVFNEDPDFCGRCKIRVFSIFDDEIQVPDNKLPWFSPRSGCNFSGKGNGNLSVPKVGAIVRVQFANGDLYSGEYWAIENMDPQMIEEIKDNYEGTNVICYDETDDYKYYIMFQPSHLTKGKQDGKGVKIFMNEGEIQITPDARIIIKTPDSQALFDMTTNKVNLAAKRGGTIDVAADGGTINLTGATVNVVGGNVNLGKNASQRAVCGDKLVTYLRTLNDILGIKTPIGVKNPLPEDYFCSNSVRVSS